MTDYSNENSTDSNEIQCIKVTPLNVKFADDKLSHRDYLGALMNLGIKREVIDDIICGDNVAYIFVTKQMADYICKELLTVKHTTVNAICVDESECDIEPEIEEETVNVASERLDVIISAVYGFSRNLANRMIMAERVSVDGNITTNNSLTIKPGNKISVRKYGKFVYYGIENQSKKGRYFVRIGKFV